MWIPLLLFLLAASAGAVLPVQTGANVTLGRALGHPLAGTFVNFVVGIVAITIVALALRVPLPAGGNFAKAAGLPAWAWIGGLLGAAMVTIAILVQPKLGATATFGAIIAGQLVGALVVDHFGLVGAAVRPVDGPKLLGVLLLASGAGLLVWSR